MHIRKRNYMWSCLMVLCYLAVTGFGEYYDKVSDKQLSSAIQQRFELDGRISANHIVINVKDGHVQLSGMVNTVTEKILAEGLVAGSIVGVKSVLNNISVRPPVSQDDAIKRQVEEYLKTTPALRGKSIHVHVNEGIVKLEGVVATVLQRRAAEKAAEISQGVKGIVNLVIVKPSRPDQEIEKEVAFYLLWSPIVNIDLVEFSVKDGFVKLKGAVEHNAHILTLEQDIEKIQGVVAVDVSKMAVQNRHSRAA